MSFAIPAIGDVSPYQVQQGANAPLASNEASSRSAAATTLAVEKGAAAVVYEPGKAEDTQSYTYAFPEFTGRLPVPSGETLVERQAVEDKEKENPINPPLPAAAQPAESGGDEAVVQATANISVPSEPIDLASFAPSAPPAIEEAQAPAVPAAPDFTVAAANTQAQQVGQAEAHAQASYAAIADSQISGVPIADLPKYA